MPSMDAEINKDTMKINRITEDIGVAHERVEGDMKTARHTTQDHKDVVARSQTQVNDNGQHSNADPMSLDYEGVLTGEQVTEWNRRHANVHESSSQIEIDELTVRDTMDTKTLVDSLFIVIKAMMQCQTYYKELVILHSNHHG